MNVVRGARKAFLQRFYLGFGVSLLRCSTSTISGLAPLNFLAASYTRSPTIRKQKGGAQPNGIGKLALPPPTFIFQASPPFGCRGHVGVIVGLSAALPPEITPRSASGGLLCRPAVARGGAVSDRTSPTTSRSGGGYVARCRCGKHRRRPRPACPSLSARRRAFGAERWGSRSPAFQWRLAQPPRWPSAARTCRRPALWCVAPALIKRTHHSSMSRMENSTRPSLCCTCALNIWAISTFCGSAIIVRPRQKITRHPRAVWSRP